MKNWEEILKRRLSSFEEKSTPSQEEAIWESIKSEIPGASASSAPTDFSVGLRGLGVVASSVVIGLVIFYALSEESVVSQDQIYGEKMSVEEGLLIEKEPVKVNGKEGGEETQTKPSILAQKLDVQESPLQNRKEIASQDKIVFSKEQLEAEDLENLHRLSDDLNGLQRENDNIETRKVDQEYDADIHVGAYAGRKERDRGSIAGHSIAEKTAGDQTLLLLPPRFFQFPENDMPMRRIAPCEGLPDPQEVRIPFGIRLYGGPTMSQFAFGEDNALDLNQYFSLNYGAGGGLMLEFERWSQSFALGLSWNEWIQHLEFVEETESTIVTEGVQSIEINQITGDTMSWVMGDVEGLEYRSRSISHYNTYRAFSVPIEWQRQRYIGRWQLGFSLGALIQFRTYAEGRMLTPEGLIAEYSNSNLLQSRLSWTPTARLYTGFFIAPEWRLDLSYSAGIQRFNNRPNKEVGFTGNPAWRGRFQNGQIQLGVTRYFSRK